MQHLNRKLTMLLLLLAPSAILAMGNFFKKATPSTPTASSSLGASIEGQVAALEKEKAALDKKYTQSEALTSLKSFWGNTLGVVDKAGKGLGKLFHKEDKEITSQLNFLNKQMGELIKKRADYIEEHQKIVTRAKQLPQSTDPEVGNRIEKLKINQDVLKNFDTLSDQLETTIKRLQEQQAAHKELGELNVQIENVLTGPNQSLEKIKATREQAEKLLAKLPQKEAEELTQLIKKLRDKEQAQAKLQEEQQAAHQKTFDDIENSQRQRIITEAAYQQAETANQQKLTLEKERTSLEEQVQKVESLDALSSLERKYNEIQEKINGLTSQCDLSLQASGLKQFVTDFERCQEIPGVKQEITALQKLLEKITNYVPQSITADIFTTENTLLNTIQKKKEALQQTNVLDVYAQELSTLEQADYFKKADAAQQAYAQFTRAHQNDFINNPEELAQITIDTFKDIKRTWMAQLKEYGNKLPAQEDRQKLEQQIKELGTKISALPAKTTQALLKRLDALKDKLQKYEQDYLRAVSAGKHLITELNHDLIKSQEDELDKLLLTIAEKIEALLKTPVNRTKKTIPIEIPNTKEIAQITEKIKELEALFDEGPEDNKHIELGDLSDEISTLENRIAATEKEMLSAKLSSVLKSIEEQLKRSTSPTKTQKITPPATPNDLESHIKELQQQIDQRKERLKERKKNLEALYNNVAPQAPKAQSDINYIDLDED